MTREEEIKQAVENNLDVSVYTPQDGEMLKETFYIGAKWADANPKQEFVDLSQVWHPAEEVPTKEQPILYFTKNGKIAVLNRVDVEKWDWYLDKYSILLWCYTEDVLPKGDKKWAI